MFCLRVPSDYYFEVVECLRRISLTGLLVFYKDGTTAQIVFAAIIALTSLGAYGLLSPYRDPAVDYTATVAQYMLFLQVQVVAMPRIKEGRNDRRKCV